MTFLSPIRSVRELLLTILTLILIGALKPSFSDILFHRNRGCLYFSNRNYQCSTNSSAFGKAVTSTSVVFTSAAAIAEGLGGQLGTAKELVAVSNVRGSLTKASMIHNAATPHIEVDPETYEVRADGELLTCEPAEVLPMAQRYFLY